MGKYSQYKRRGGAVCGLAIAPPGSADWTATVVSDVRVDLYGPTPIPLPADRYAWRMKLHSASTWGSPWISTSFPYIKSGLSATTTYDFSCAYSDAGSVLSEWSDTKTVTTLT